LFFLKFLNTRIFMSAALSVTPLFAQTSEAAQSESLSLSPKASLRGRGVIQVDKSEITRLIKENAKLRSELRFYVVDNEGQVTLRDPGKAPVEEKDNRPDSEIFTVENQTKLQTENDALLKRKSELQAGRIRTLNALRSADSEGSSCCCLAVTAIVLIASYFLCPRIL
jgi:hypothetical protein